jgi:hypothetical protein
MYHMKKVSVIASSITAAGILGMAAILPLAAFAETTSVSAAVNVSTAGVTANTAAKVTTSLSKAIARADQEIERRITNLNALSTRIGAMKNVSATEKTSLQASITSQISTLTTLKATIDAETVAANLKTDIQSITKDYRIYMLVLPQGRIAAATDRVLTIVGDMQALAPELQTRITAAASAGKDMTAANAAYTDMQAKIADANTQATAAVTETASLTPDQGNTTIAASNTAAIKDAAAKIKTATTDLKAARADIQIILKAVKGTGSASTTASTTVN